MLNHDEQFFGLVQEAEGSFILYCKFRDGLLNSPLYTVIRKLVALMDDFLKIAKPADPTTRTSQDFISLLCSPSEMSFVKDYGSFLE